MPGIDGVPGYDGPVGGMGNKVRKHSVCSYIGVCVCVQNDYYSVIGILTVILTVQGAKGMPGSAGSNGSTGPIGIQGATVSCMVQYAHMQTCACCNNRL